MLNWTWYILAVQTFRRMWFNRLVPPVKSRISSWTLLSLADYFQCKDIFIKPCLESYRILRLLYSSVNAFSTEGVIWHPCAIEINDVRGYFKVFGLCLRWEWVKDIYLMQVSRLKGGLNGRPGNLENPPKQLFYILNCIIDTTDTESSMAW